ncbi:MAG: TonB-dependent receptor domain-containing protein [Gemmatimonadota bacterium]
MKQIRRFSLGVVWSFTLALLVVAPVIAQEGVITGRVTDAASLQPLDGAQVFVVGTARGVLANAEGRYTLRLPAGTYTIQSRYLGYNANEQTVTLEEGETLTIDFALDVGGLVVDEIVVTGTRTQRSALETTVPVDVITSVELQQSPQTELAQVIRDIIPSFNASKQTISDGTDHVDPASLRGLGPDQVLVLINGKRRHNSALTNVNGTFGRGTVGTDLNAIPVAAIERIEVLRDGAAAQYGSDAIAGVINIVLKTQTEGLTGSIQSGVTGEGDGDQVKADANFGFAIGESGYFNVTGEYLNRGRTDRSDPYQGALFFTDRAADDAEIAARGLTRKELSMKTGQGEAIIGSAFFNGAFKVSDDAEIYTFGGITHRNGIATGFYRRPIQEARVVYELYPNGFLPQIQTQVGDQAITTGLRGRKGAWDLDFSVSHGRNSFQFNIENTNNASLGAASPTSFDAGNLSYRQTTGNFDAVRLINTNGAVKSLSLVLGGDFRVENYRIGAGQFESYSLGNGGPIPGVDFDTTSTGSPKAAGSQVFPGFQPSNEVNRSRNNVAVYAGLETQFSDRFQLDVAGRYENYSDFGGTFNGKVAARFELTETVALRGAASTGFRAPSLNQLWFNNVSTQFVIDPVTGELVPARVLTGNNKDPVTRAFGVPDLKEETSINFSGGLTWRPLNRLSITSDAYYIGIQDRVVLSSRFSTSNPDIGDDVADILAPFSSLGVSQAQFFANAVDTETFGLDVVVNYLTEFQAGTLNLTGSANFTSTEVTSINVAQSIADRFTQGNTDAIASTLFNREERNRLETALPRQAGTVSARWARGKINTGIRGNYFGGILYRPTNPDNDEDFGAKVLFDADIGYELWRGVTVQVGANNILNTFPDKHQKAANISNGNFPYSRRVTQFGMNGGFYYARVKFALGN